MRVLILSVTVGQGHNKTAQAIGDQLSTLGIEYTILDTLDYISKALATTNEQVYLLGIKKELGQPYASVYSAAENRKKSKDVLSLTRTLNYMMGHKLLKFIDAYAPDVIISTHIYPPMMLDTLKQRGMLDIPCIAVETDYLIHPFLEESTRNEYLVTASPLLNMQAYRKGFKKEQILPFGIPVRSVFNQKEAKQPVRKRLGLAPDKFTILMMGGSMGFGKMEESVQLLDKMNLDMQFIIVCGSNKNSYEKLTALKLRKKAMIVGFVDNIHNLMDAADIILTKPGGLTTSEALVKQLPMILCDPIPGHEERNVEFFLNNGVAMTVSETMRLDEVVFQYFYYEKRALNLKNSIDLIRKPNAAKDLAEFVKKLCQDRKKQQNDKPQD
ncbi:MAG: glycosyltransferase [Eubacteriales bacterium]|nr:glycosyltransferase [Eubacteriales bacterium]MDD4475358.1 glycosyltransferase [Eubacteriales bacterium]